MSELEQIQRHWLNYLQQGSSYPPLQTLLTPQDYDGSAVYRKSCRAILFNHLRDTFPRCLYVLGAKKWLPELQHYCDSIPSHHHDVGQYGAMLHADLKQRPQGKQHPYLSQLCHAEWLWYQLSYQPYIATFDFARLSQLENIDITKVTFELNPSVALIGSKYPLYQLWQVSEQQSDAQIDLSIAESIMLYKLGHQACIAKLDRDTLSFVQALKNQQSWGAIYNDLGEQKAPALLQQALNQGWITGYQGGSII